MSIFTAIGIRSPGQPGITVAAVIPGKHTNMASTNGATRYTVHIEAPTAAEAETVARYAFLEV